MDETVEKWLGALQLGDMKRHDAFGVLPLFNCSEPHLAYVALVTALERNDVSVTETSEGGTVGSLKVVNSGLSPVLVLDGEELEGAKQNRIVNTAILLKEQSETVIPVSCTEQGRWSYMSRTFRGSEAFAPPQMRRMNQSSVRQSLRNQRGFQTDQGAVWAEVSRMASESGVDSQTQAMRDVYSARMPELNDVVETIRIQPGQCGIMALHGDAVLGFDILSRPEVYEVLHARLLRSYFMHTPFATGHAFKGDPAAFLKAVLDSKESSHDSAGHGEDHRYQGTSLVGSALTSEGEGIHAAFFHVPDSDQSTRTGSLWTMSQRRRYRM